ncbi:Trk system potassium uptake protein [Rhodospirillaceae bacterium LM-1]|nr:Trk system potassium uptake protein [Rhodospirillaceae bacterium LM-1]
MELRPIFLVLGLLVSTLALFMFFPALADLVAHHEDWKVFGISGLVTFFTGLLFVVGSRGSVNHFTLRHGFVLTSLSWVVLSAFGALPFVFSHMSMSYTDAYFEAMSGLTTTGATVIVGLDNAPPGILLWRAILHGIGGVGIIVMAVAVLPSLRVGGMQFFRMESSDKSEKFMPKAAQMAMGIILVYLALVILCFLVLWAAGMSAFDAICHALSAISTGGFSTKDASVGYFANPLFEWILVFFMLSGALPLTYYVRVAKEGWQAAAKGSQVLTFLGVLAVFSLVLTLWLWIVRGDGFFDALRLASFNVISVITTTGFVTQDFSLWGDFAMMVFFLAAFVGGCTGSTTGSVKIFRWQVLTRYVRTQLALMYQPNRVFTLKYDQSTYSNDVVLSVIMFVVVYFLSTAFLALAVSLTGLDFLSALTSVVSSIGNVGPGLGSTVGPCCTFEPLNDAAIWLLSLAMLLGRLEIFTLLILLTPNFWRR